MAKGSMAEDATVQTLDATQPPETLSETLSETFIVVHGTLLHDGQAFPVGADFRCDDPQAIRELLACRAIARPDEARQSQQVAQTLDENASLKSQVRELERQIAEARATIEKRERVM